MIAGETSVVLVRHGESVANASGVIAGWRTCGGLSEQGREQCRRLADRLRRTGELADAVVLTSPFLRARQTAEAIASVVGVEPIAVEGFGEIDPGERFDGVSYADFVAAHGAPDWAALAADPALSMFPGGETMADFRTRIDAALSDAVAAHAGRLIVVATHGGVVDAAMRVVTGAPARGRFSLWTTNTSLTQITRTVTERHVGSDPELWRVERYNDAAHLAW